MGSAVDSIVAARMSAHALALPEASVVAVARRMLALQGQDAAQVRWALAVRTPAATLADVDRAFAARTVVRTWCLRGTLHAVAAEDAGWLVRLCAARNIARAASRLRALGIGEDDLHVARGVVEATLAGGRSRSREALFAELEGAGQATGHQRGVHLLWRLAQDAVIVQAGDDFVLLGESVAAPRDLVGDAALAALAAGYRRGHGPAGVDDFAHWSGLAKGVAKRALTLAGAEAEPAGAASVPQALLLPGFDEYLLGYLDRSACIDAADFTRVVPGGNGIFLPMLVLDGRVTGTWRRRLGDKRADVTVSPFAPLSAARRRAVERAAERYGAYLERPIELTFD